MKTQGRWSFPELKPSEIQAYWKEQMELDLDEC